MIRSGFRAVLNCQSPVKLGFSSLAGKARVLYPSEGLIPYSFFPMAACRQEDNVIGCGGDTGVPMDAYAHLGQDRSVSVVCARFLEAECKFS